MKEEIMIKEIKRRERKEKKRNCKEDNDTRINRNETQMIKERKKNC